MEDKDLMKAISLAPRVGGYTATIIYFDDHEEVKDITFSEGEELVRKFNEQDKKKAVADPELLKKYVAKMLDIKDGDTESRHLEADGLLCDLLEELGYGEVVKVYESYDKWYA